MDDCTKGPTRWPLGGLLGILIALVGCGGPGWLQTYPVKGTILVDGSPAKEAMVVFHPKVTQPERPHLPTGKTNENGEFELSTFVTSDGAPAGEYDVTVTWPTRYNPISTLWEGDKLNGKYAKKDRPAAKVTIEAKAQQLAPIELTTKKE